MLHSQRGRFRCWMWIWCTSTTSNINFTVFTIKIKYLKRISSNSWPNCSLWAGILNPYSKAFIAFSSLQALISFFFWKKCNNIINKLLNNFLLRPIFLVDFAKICSFKCDCEEGQRKSWYFTVSLPSTESTELEKFSDNEKCHDLNSVWVIYWHKIW